MNIRSTIRNRLGVLAVALLPGFPPRHVSEDSLVGWAWSPGIGRSAAPGTQAELGATMRAWASSGAHCPPE